MFAGAHGGEFLVMGFGCVGNGALGLHAVASFLRVLLSV